MPYRDADVLVVEDDDALRRMFAEVLREEGFAVRTASDGLEAMRQIGEHPPEVVVLDLLLPWMSGRQVLAKMREQPELRSIPVIVVTGTATRQHELREFSPVRLLRKPFDIETLPPTVRELLAA